ncbi:MAG: hypothetical protein EA416_00760, partial [Trueperaceae bacterium]
SSRTLSDLRTSNSWRLTAPLRRGRALADRAIQRAKRSSTLRAVARRVRGALRSRPAAPGSTAPGSTAPGPTARRRGPRDSRDPLELLHAHAVPDEAALRSAYEASDVAREPATFALVRVIGNDLYPRHKRGQSRENLAFVLEHEPELEGCTKAWIVNRIQDTDEEAAIIELLDRHGQTYRRIAFDQDAYARIGFDHAALPSPDYLASADHAALEPAMQRRLVTALYRPKNLYVMHNNGARNAAVEYAHELATWALPWDGNGFVRADAWNALREAVLARPYLPYFVVPMQRVEDNADLLRDDYHAHPVEEPQVVLRRDARERFDERFPYGRRPKVELFWRLGVPGPWERWNDDPWDQVRNPQSQEAGRFGVAGWVARLASGVAHLERSDLASFRDRGVVRQSAIVATIDRLDEQVHARLDEVDDVAPATLLYAPRSLTAARAALADRTHAPASAVVGALLAHADAALARGPYAVTDKTTTAPSGDARDYWHPAPYWWPNPATRDGLPYVRRDGERVPGTRMYEPSSDRYDRTRLQRVFDDTTALALAGHLTGRDDLLQRGAATVRRWFLDPEHGMRPHLRYAQVRLGHDGDEGAPTGIIEMKDLYYLLDAARVLRHHGALTSEDDAALRVWLETYRAWLATSRQGIAECAAPNNHGTYYDLQTGAIAAYLDDHDGVRAALLRAEGRLAVQFDDDGEQPHERSRTISAHYYLFNLQGWLHLLHLGARCGYVPRDLDAVSPFDRVGRGVSRLFALAAEPWPYQQQGPVAWERLEPIASMALRLGLAEHVPEAWRGRSVEGWLAATPVLDPHDGAHPYWNLAWCAHASGRRAGDA